MSSKRQKSKLTQKTLPARKSQMASSDEDHASIWNEKGFRLFLSLFLTGIIGGYILGRYISPTYDDPTRSPIAIRHFIASSVAIQALPLTPYDGRGFKKTHYKNGRLESITPVAAILTYKCGVKNYNFDGRSVKIGPAPLGAYDYVDFHPRKRLSPLDSFTFLFGGLQAYQLNTTVPKYVQYVEGAETSGAVARRVVGGLVALASGAGIGIYLGYSNDPQCGEGLFSQALVDPLFWKSVASEVDSMNTFYIGYAKGGKPLLDQHHGAGSRYSYSALFTTLRAAGETNLELKTWGLLY